MTCTCGSGAHPRRCAQHPEAYAAHVAELNAEWTQCPHSLHGHPSTCSQCRGASARKVDIIAGQILVDGSSVRANEEPVSLQAESARRRGQRASGETLARAARGRK